MRKIYGRILGWLLAFLLLSAGCVSEPDLPAALPMETAEPTEGPYRAEPDPIRIVAEPQTALSAPPTVVLSVRTKQDLAQIAVDAPQAAWFRLSAAEPGFFETEDGLIHVSEAFRQCYGAVIPIFELPNMEAAQALETFAKKNRNTDFLIAARDASVLQSFHLTGVQKGLLLDRVTERCAGTVHAAGGDFVAISEITRAEAEYLQMRWIAVVLTPDTDTETAVKMALDVGADQVVVRDAKEAYRLYTETAPEEVTPRRTFSVAHRGISSRAPENTLESFREAVKAGADAVECDVYVTKDCHLVISHNASTGAYTADGTDANVEELTRDELKALRLKPVGEYTDARFAFLDEFLDEMKGNDIQLVIEIKTDNPDCAVLIRSLVEERDLLDRIQIIGFSTEQIARSRHALPEVPASLLANVGVSEPKQYLRSYYTNTADFGGAYSPSKSFTPEGVAAFRHRGILINIWTIDGAEELQKQIQGGVTSLTTNTVYLLGQE